MMYVLYLEIEKTDSCCINFCVYYTGCCIYEKPRVFGESSDESGDDDDCTDSCHGHKKKCFSDHNGDSGADGTEG